CSSPSCPAESTSSSLSSVRRRPTDGSNWAVNTTFGLSVIRWSPISRVMVPVRVRSGGPRDGEILPGDAGGSGHRGTDGRRSVNSRAGRRGDESRRSRLHRRGPHSRGVVGATHCRGAQARDGGTRGEAVCTTPDYRDVAGGGLASRDEVHGALGAGAGSPQCGTACLLADEACANPVHRASLQDPG